MGFELCSRVGYSESEPAQFKLAARAVAMY
jgi:hypothetical protein